MHDRITVVALAVVLLALAACTGRERAAPVAQAAAPAVPDGAPAVVTIHAKDFAYVAPDTVPSGMVTFNLINDGPSFHHATIFRIDSGKTMADLLAALRNPGPPPTWAVPIGGPNAPAPGSTSDATLNLAPGNYAILCLVDIPGGVPHFMKGMEHAFTAVAPGGATTSAAVAPTADIDVTMKDYGYTFSKPLTAGHHVFAVTNNGPQVHEIEMVKLDSGKTVEDLTKWMMKPVGPPPGQPIGGVAAEVPGRTAYFSANFTAGNYVSMCLVSDAKDGKPHLMHGMELLQKVN